MIEQVANALIKNQTIKEEEKELYTYGLRQGIIMITQAVSLLCVGILYGMWWQSILFMFAYAPLRLSAGGVHANKQWICFICTLLHFALVMTLIRFIQWSTISIIITSVISGAGILFFAPVEDKNKPFDEVEKKVHTKRTRIALFIELTIITLLLLFALNEIAESIAVTIGTLAIMVVIGQAKNSIEAKHKN
jgi:accessory gene regulator B